MYWGVLLMKKYTITVKMAEMAFKWTNLIARSTEF